MAVRNGHPAPDDPWNFLSEMPERDPLLPPTVAPATRPAGRPRPPRVVRLRGYLTRMVWLAALPLLLFEAALGAAHVIEARRAIDRQAAGMAREAAHTVDRMLRARIRGLLVLASSPDLDDPADWPEVYGLARAYHDAYGPHVALADHALRLRFATQTAYGSAPPPPPEPFWQVAAPRALQSGRPQVSDAFGYPQASAGVAFAVPVLRADRPVAVLLGTLDASYIQRFLDDPAVPRNWSLALRDSQGRLISGQGSGQGAMPARFDSGLSEPVRHVHALEWAPWQVVVDVPASAYLEPVAGALWRLLMLLLLLATVGLVAGRLAGARLRRALEWLVKPSSGETGNQANSIEELRRLAVVVDESAYRREAAEHAWAESAATCRMLFDDHTAPLWVLARDSLRFLDVNQAAVDRFGHGRERFKGLSAADLVAPEERSRLEDLTAFARPGDAMAARRHVGPPTMGSARWRLRTADGTRLECDLRCRPISHLGQPALLVRLREQPAMTGKTTQEPARP